MVLRVSYGHFNNIVCVEPNRASAITCWYFVRLRRTSKIKVIAHSSQVARSVKNILEVFGKLKFFLNNWTFSKPTYGQIFDDAHKLQMCLSDTNSHHQRNKIISCCENEEDERSALIAEFQNNFYRAALECNENMTWSGQNNAQKHETINLKNYVWNFNALVSKYVEVSGYIVKQLKGWRSEVTRGSLARFFWRCHVRTLNILTLDRHEESSPLKVTFVCAAVDDRFYLACSLLWRIITRHNFQYQVQAKVYREISGTAYPAGCEVSYSFDVFSPSANLWSCHTNLQI